MESLLDLQRTIKKPTAFKREMTLRREYASKDKPSGWGTTDPQRHNPDNFRYFVHTTSKDSLDYAVRLTYDRGLGPKREVKNNPWSVLIADFLSRNSTSCTLIDEIHRATYKDRVMPHGFILDVPEENIVIFDPSDLGTHNQTQDKQERDDFYKNGIVLRCNKDNTPSAQTFLEACRCDFYNEVVVDGIGPKGRQIRISAVFFLTDPYLGIPLDDLTSRLSWHPRAVFERIFSHGHSDEEYLVKNIKDAYQEMKKVAQLLQIPVIHIPTIFI